MRNWGIVVGLLVCCAVFGQPAPEVQWTRTFGGNADDQGFWLENAPGGGFIIPAVNGSGEHGGPDAWLIKTNPNGDMQWNRQYGGGSFDEIRSVDVIPEVGYIALGTTASFGAGGEDFFLVKTNLEGNVIWTRTYGGIGDEHGRFVRRCEDNGYIMTGYTTSYGEGGRDIWLVKTNVEGDIQWTETYGGDEDEEGYSVRLAGDGYCLAGYTESFGAGDYDVYVLRVSGAGDVIWSRVFGGTEREFAPGLRNTQDGGFIVAGSTNSFSAGWSDGYAIRLNGAGDTLWTRSYGTAIPESFHLPLVMPDGGFVFMGVNQYPPYNMWVIRTNPSGNPIWERTLNAPGMEWTLGGQLAPDGGIIICGSTESFGNGGSDVYLVRLAPDVPPPPEHHFIPVPPTGLPYAVVIDNAVIDGEPLHAGDEIGIFDGELCVGAGTLTEGWPLTVTTWQGDPEQELAGFTVGHTMIFRLFVHNSNADVMAEADFSVGDGTFGSGVYSRAVLFASLAVPQEIPLRPNYFELISLNVWPEEPTAANVFGELEHLVAAYEDNGNVFIPPDIHTLNELHRPEGYRLISTVAETLHVVGAPLPSNLVYELHPGSWQWISYPLSAAAPVQLAMGEIAGHIIIVQNDDGDVWIPSQNINTLGELLPGKGYMVLVNSPVAFSYAAGDGISALRKHTRLATPADAPRPTGLPYAVIVHVPAALKAAGAYVVELHDGSLCVGKTFVSAEERTLVTAWQGIADYDLPGFVPGHSILVTLKDAKGNELSAMLAGDAGTFGAGGYGEIHFADGSVLPETFAVSEGYPNPFNPAVTFTITLLNGGPVEFKVFNSLGQEVNTVSVVMTSGEHRYSLDMRDFLADPVSGMYFVSVRHGSTGVLRKILLLR